MEKRIKLLDSRICCDKFGKIHKLEKLQIKKLSSNTIVNSPQVKRKVNVSL